MNQFSLRSNKGQRLRRARGFAPACIHYKHTRTGANRTRAVCGSKSLRARKSEREARVFTCLFVDRCYEYSKIQFVSTCTRGDVISSMSPWEGKYIAKLRNCALHRSQEKSKYRGNKYESFRGFDW